jgi:hypothetical protein
MRMCGISNDAEYDCAESVHKVVVVLANGKKR